MSQCYLTLCSIPILLAGNKPKQIFDFFKQHPLFHWNDANNDCEDRANAICILLSKWGIPNYKGWVFGGAYLKREEGSLVNFWNYHVAAALPILENGEPIFILSIRQHPTNWSMWPTGRKSNQLGVELLSHQRQSLLYFPNL